MLTKRDYQYAIYAQSACNLSGIVNSFAEMLPRIWEEARAKGQGTEYVNCHPISRLFAEQIAHLSGAGMGNPDTWQAAYAEAERLANAEPIITNQV
jgi:hypothetical protein